MTGCRGLAGVLEQGTSTRDSPETWEILSSPRRREARGCLTANLQADRIGPVPGLREERRQAARGTAKRRTTKRGGTDDRKSERPIVPMKPENPHVPTCLRQVLIAYLGNGARKTGRLTTMTSDETPRDPEVPEKARRRTFTEAYKQRILDELATCTKRGETGAVLRREGLYRSHISKWRRQRAEHGLEPQKRGRKPKSAAERRLSELEAALKKSEREKKRLEDQLERARLMLELQKKVADIMSLPLETEPSEDADEKPS